MESSTAAVDDLNDTSNLYKLLHVASEFRKVDLTTALDDYQKLKNALLNEKRQLEKANKNLESKCRDVHHLHAQLQQAETENKKCKAELKLKEKELHKKTAALTEKDETLTRDNVRGKEFEMKSSGNNSDIDADLCDPYRPFKIAEMYIELYDNEWTDALESLCEDSPVEDENTKKLLDVLKKCYELCKELAEKQMESLELTLVNPIDPKLPKSAFGGMVKTPDSICQHLKDFRKQMSSHAVDNIPEEYVAGKIGNIAKLIPKYVKKCISVCWFMCVLNPPVVIGNEATVNETFDTNIYKRYTNNGTVVSYNVWPPLLLHQNGSLLVKGIVQPIKVEKKKMKDHVGLTGMKAIPAVKDRTDYGTTYSLRNNDRFTGNAGYDPYEDVYGRTESVRKNKPFQTETSWRDHTPYLDYSRTTDHDPYTQVATHGSDSHRSHVRDHVEAKRSNIGTYHYESTRPSTNYVQQSVSPERSTFKHNGVTYIQIGDKYLKYEDYKSYLRKHEESYA
ncbi:uncharacterized protein LOC117321242 isoform X2 [Pecten maximus]|uniref:uncharacterized protein LOC117321242 isoform X2 n=1 Tax=Pecten maximus TaxID=6579 RepID=UPI001458A9C0|nr:uncharacterized protein LOC117321242 isoform X2 [Pecten maximus]